MVELLIAEKPSVARDIARVIGAATRRDGFLEGNGYRVGWCFGHMLTLWEPHQYDPAWKQWTTKTLPMIPPTFKTKARRGAGKQLTVLRKLARATDITAVINACDAGREGELIFRWVWEAIAPRRKNQPEIKRLWIASLTDKAIREGMANLRPAAEFDRLGDAARSRSEADWLVGLNATRAMTLLGRRGGARKTLLSVGRVQTPTLAMLAAREDAIDAFVPEAFWQVKARFALTGQRSLDAIYTQRGKDRLDNRAAAQAVARAVSGRQGQITEVDQRREVKRAPALYDLTTLQKAANRRYGMSAKRTLAAAQTLYEQHKALTYPRTDSRFVTADVGAKLPKVVARLQQTSTWGAIATEACRGGAKPTRRVVNPSEVGDHHAILPTGYLPDPTRLGADAKRVYDLVVRRLLAVFLPDAVFAKSTVTTTVATDGDTYAFVARGTTRLVQGWQLAEPPARPAPDKAEPSLPTVKRGEAAQVAQVKVHEGKTQPPKRHTEATLLGAMETAGRELPDDALRRAMRAAGLGTPATRAAIIETLLDRDYVRRERRSLVPTAQGRALVASLPVPALLSPELTGRWEAELSAMAEGRAKRDAFMARIAAFTTETVKTMRLAEPPKAMAQAAAEPGPPLGSCPLCGTAVREGTRAYACETGRACDFVIFKTIAKRKISPTLVKVLLAKGRSRRLRGFKSKTGKSFSTALVLGKDGKIAFDFGRD